MLPRFAKASVFESPIPLAALACEIGPDIDVVANSMATEGMHSGELFQRGISKADGVAVAIAFLGIDRTAPPPSRAGMAAAFAQLGLL
ncbi:MULTISPECIES: hypothetical protein [Arthrobacter]|uniref:hypothetical protein n=1 Tax=Arthrobacter TaxID=1663 RepID=UPI000784B01F|nr:MULTISPECIES: hypothetical protein [Arthrobacter]